MKFLVILVQIFFLVHPHPGGRHYLLEVAGGKRYLVENGSNNNLVQNRGKIHLHNGGKNNLVQNGGKNRPLKKGGSHFCKGSVRKNLKFFENFVKANS